MRRLIAIVTILILSVIVGLEITQHPGYAVFTWRQWVIQMPLWFALLSVIIGFLFFYAIIRSFAFLETMSMRWRAWFLHRRRTKAYTKTQKGLLDLVQEDWKNAEKNLLDGVANKIKNPVINYIGAAEAAFQQNEFELCDEYLLKAYHVSPKDEVVIGIKQAHLLLQQDQLEQLTLLLGHLHQLSPHHPAILKLMEKLYVRLSDWHKLLELLPSLQKAKIINSEQYFLFEKNIYSEILQESSRKKKSLHDVRELWQNMPKKIRYHADILARYGRLVKDDKSSAEELEPIIRKILSKEWDDNLAEVYSLITLPESLRQLSIAETWIKQYGKRPALMLLLGRLCMRNQLWGKARDYLEEGLRQGENGEIQLELGKLFEQLGETQFALQHYKTGLQEAIT